MKKWVHDELICPFCTDTESPLNLEIETAVADEIVAGTLSCPACRETYPITDGIAALLPEKSRNMLSTSQGYNAPAMLSAYLWSHFCDLIGDSQATDAYAIWADTFRKARSQTNGLALDVGCAVGRLSFELSATHSRVIGLDTSMAFIRKARDILVRKRLDFDLIVEGHLTEPRGCTLNPDWNLSGVEFIVADAMALPFRKNRISTVAAINILEKVPDPIRHLSEVNRVMVEKEALFLFSDPFSWDEAFSRPDRWLGGNLDSRYCPRGIDTLRRLFSGEDHIFDPALALEDDGKVSWKIRKTENLWEHITSHYLVGRR
ncbi:methyltransferase domain-containing protein [Desulfosarcina sp. OttesenSCG-928-A07]|nr:methyltransferase domain-containing protein [Desulfosarcina sp. OttesenSCG-928-G17]MDL2330064.1 methyltransferase domain-containing protein [Desulfosarcina sp. OttesenSCG-928-A07]